LVDERHVFRGEARSISPNLPASTPSNPALPRLRFCISPRNSESRRLPDLSSRSNQHWDVGTIHRCSSTICTLIIDDMDMTIRAVLDGIGLAFSLEDYVAPQFASGALMRVLEDWCLPHDCVRDEVRRGRQAVTRSGS
jgi:DNA-binding transcriptional LysR family regulator